jgi:hypothetical protein
MLLPAIVNILAVVLAFQFTSVTKHRCSMCEKELGSDGKFLHYLVDEVYSFSIGRTGIILSKKILANLTLTAFLILIVVLKSRNKFAGHTYIDTTWEGFMQHCSKKSIQDASDAYVDCRHNFEGKTVKNWKGYILRLKDNRQNLYRFLEYHVALFIKMEPQLEDEDVDVMLTMDSFSVDEYEKQLDGLHHGDEIVFNATFLSVFGNRGADSPRHLHITSMNFTGSRNPKLPYYLL